MQIQVEKLRRVLELVAGTIPKKATLPVTANVRIGDGVVLATNLEQYISIRLPEASGDPFLLPHKRALEFLKAMPGNHLLEVQPNGAMVKLATGNVRSALAVPGAGDAFPPYPVVPEPVDLDVPGDALIDALEGAARYAQDDGTRPVLNCVCLTLGEPAEVCGADGFRLAWKPLTFAVRKAEEGADRLLVQRSTVAVLRHLWGKAHGGPDVPVNGNLIDLVTARRKVHMQFNGKLIAFSFGDVTLVAHLVEGAYPRYRDLVPAGGQHKVHVMGPALRHAVQQLLPIAKEGSGIVRLSWDDTGMQVAAHAEDTGDVEVSVHAAVEGEPGRIAFHSRYIREYLQGREGMVTLTTSETSNPGLFTSADGMAVVIMPMTVTWPGDPEPAPAPEAQDEGPVDEDEPEGQDDQETEEGEPAESPAPAPKSRRQRRAKASQP